MTVSGPVMLERITVGPLQENCYLLGSDRGERAVLVDPGDEADRLFGALQEAGRELEGVLLTHAHFDHVGALAPLLERVQVPVYLHSADRLLLANARAAAAKWGIEIPQPPLSTVELHHDEVLRVAGLELICRHTPGHAPGHIAFHVPSAGLVLAGDALFKGSIGRTDLPFGDHDQLLTSIRRELLTLPGDTVVWPGHGPETTIAVEAATNPFLT